MSYLESLDTDRLVLIANQIQTEYNRVRKNFCDKAEYYNRQAITSHYHKEDDLAELIMKCKELKGRYKAVADIMLRRGYKPDISGWRDSNNFLFTAEDILHSA